MHGHFPMGALGGYRSGCITMTVTNKNFYVYLQGGGLTWMC
ncbi:hypothetical protein V1288_005554 [Bradyrhizobium sp. AZCC 2176]